MSKFGWSLPPGVSTSDLPGNSAAEAAQEALIEHIYDTLAPLRPENPTPHYEELEDKAAEEIEKAISGSFRDGYKDGTSDAFLEFQGEIEDIAREWRTELYHQLSVLVGSVPSGMSESFARHAKVVQSRIDLLTLILKDEP